MATKESILSKIQILITNQFESPEEAFDFFDKDGSGKLKKSEVIRLLKEAEISAFIRGIVATKLVQGYDTTNDRLISWEEFKEAIDEIEDVT
ncbi:MAG: EF-hand domain-containing protein [Flavobacteriaceae bacterium]|nr:EF-hand domain-containing protein [Flavobacteriaceae bacterium]